MSVKFRTFARGRARRTPGQMNKLEQAYAEHLRLRQLAGEIAEFRYEGYKIRLAKSCFLTPDFFVLLPDGRTEFHEVKGFMEDDAAVKLKVVAEQHWWFRFLVVKQIPKRDGGGWQVVEVLT